MTTPTPTLPQVNPTNPGSSTPASSPYSATPTVPAVTKPPVTPAAPTTSATGANSVNTVPVGTGTGNTSQGASNPTSYANPSITAPFGSNASGLPYGSQYSNNPNPDSSVYGANGNPVSPSSTSGVNENGLTSSEQSYEDQMNQFATSLAGIANGSTPLNAGEEAQVQGLEAQFQQTIAKQQAVNANTAGTTSQRGFQTGAAEYDSTFRSNTINDVLSAGVTAVNNLQTEEASAVATLTESLQQNDIKGIQDAMSAYETANTATAAAVQKAVADTQQAMQDSSVQAVIASGITDPSDILIELQSQGHTDVTLAEVNSVISALSPDAANIFAIQKSASANGAPQSVLAAIASAPNQTAALTAAGIYNTTMIPDLQKLAESNGAPQSVINAIGQATDSNSALQAAAGYTQTASGTLGDYLEYQRQTIAAGQTPEDYTTYQNAQNATAANLAMNKAIQTADTEAAYKSQLDTQNGVLTSAQNSRVTAISSALNSNKDVQAFISVAGQLPILQGIPAGTTDPEQQGTLLASIAHILSPNSSSLRGALNAIDPSSLNSGTYNFLNGIANIADPRGKLSPDAVNQLISIGEDQYNSYLTTYQSIRSAMVQPALNEGIPDDNFPDYSQVSAPTTSQVVQQQTNDAATAVASFTNQSPANAALYQQVLAAAPNATPIEFAKMLQLSGSWSTTTQTNQ